MTVLQGEVKCYHSISYLSQHGRKESKDQLTPEMRIKSNLLNDERYCYRAVESGCPW